MAVNIKNKSLGLYEYWNKFTTEKPQTAIIYMWVCVLTYTEWVHKYMLWSNLSSVL